MKIIIKKLYYNRTTCTDIDSTGEDFTTAEVGVNGVTQIVEYQPASNGEKLCYDIMRVDGRTRIYHPAMVEFEDTP